RSALPHSSVERDQAALGSIEVAGADLSRPVADRTHSARPGERQFLVDLGRLRSRLRTHCALSQSLLAFVGSAREALYQGDSALRALRHSGRNLESLALQGMAQVGRFD